MAWLLVLPVSRVPRMPAVVAVDAARDRGLADFATGQRLGLRDRLAQLPAVLRGERAERADVGDVVAVLPPGERDRSVRSDVHLDGAALERRLQAFEGELDLALALHLGLVLAVHG